MNKTITLGFFLILLIAASCSPSTLDAGKYVQWMKEETNGLHKTRKLGELTLNVQYKPIEYIALVDSRGEKTLFEKRIKELNGMEYYELNISVTKGDAIQNSAGTKEDFYNKLYYFNFQFQQDIKLKEGEKEYPCTLYHFEKSYDLANQKKFLLGFSKEESREDQVMILDLTTLGFGIEKIKFEKKDLQKIPALSL